MVRSLVLFLRDHAAPSDVLLGEVIPYPELSQPPLELHRADSPVAIDIQFAKNLFFFHHFTFSVYRKSVCPGYDT